MTLRLDKTDEEALDVLIKAQAVSKQEAIIRAIHESAARRGHESQVAEASKALRLRYADVLKRLGE